MNKTNKQIAKEQSTTSRQVSKSRKTGYITKTDGSKVKFTASPAVYISTNKTGLKKTKGSGMKKWGRK